MLTVHHLQVAQSERIAWLCEELGIPYDLKLYQRDPFFSPPDLKALHPMGAAPVITDDSLSSPLAESAACIEYIIQKHGQGRLMLPPSHPDYAQYLYWFHFGNGNLQPVISRSFMFYRLGDIIPADHMVTKNSNDRLEILLNHMNDRLGEVTWLAGNEFTAADIMNVFSLSTMRYFFPLDLTPYPNITAYLTRIRSRKAYQTAMKIQDPDMKLALDAKPPYSFLKRVAEEATAKAKGGK